MKFKSGEIILDQSKVFKFKIISIEDNSYNVVVLTDDIGETVGANKSYRCNEIDEWFELDKEFLFYKEMNDIINSKV